MRTSLIAVLVTACAAVSAAHAAPVVVVVEGEGAAPLPALATVIQLHASTDVVVRTVHQPAAPAAEISVRAAALAAADDAALVVWVAPSADDGHLVVYVAGPWPDRAVIEVVRIDAGTPAAEVEREVALRVVALLDTVMAPAAVSSLLGAEAQIAPVWRAPPWQVGMLGEVMVRDGDRGAHAALAVIGGRQWAAGRAGIAGKLRYAPEVGVDDAAVTTAVSEAGAVVEGWIAPFAGRRGALMIRAGVGGAILHARADAGDGRMGTATFATPFGGVGVSGRLRLGGVMVTLGGGVEVATVEQRLLVGPEVVASLGRLRAVIELGLVVPL